MRRFYLVLTAVALLVTSCAEESYGPVPTEGQLRWHDMEYYMFCHFGPNTFTGLEWGLGSEDPDIFNPSDLDCEQWVRTAMAAGMKGIIITAKHHDGFCLWPSAFSDHTVAQSAWRDGRGDVLAELRKACDKYDFPMGVYISPWDRNHPAYGSEGYNTVFAGTIDEVHEKYGPMFEQWFDGANGGADIPSYDWPLFNSTVYKHNPDAVIFSDVGPGCRWVGNESGYVGETNWCRLNAEGFTPGAGAPSNEILYSGEADGAAWIPAECDVPLRKGWFWNPENEGSQKSVEQLMDIWFGSVGRGANLILNVAPDNTGRIPVTDSLRLMEFKASRDDYFSKCVASTSRCSAETVLRPSGAAKCIVLSEDLRCGQRVAGFAVEAYADGQWSLVAEGTTVGHKRILRFDAPVSAEKIRVRVTSSLAKPIIKSIELY